MTTQDETASGTLVMCGGPKPPLFDWHAFRAGVALGLGLSTIVILIAAQFLK